MRYLLDTNIISNIAKASPSESLLAWMAEQNDDDLYISSLTVAEIRRGVLERPPGRSNICSAYTSRGGPVNHFSTFARQNKLHVHLSHCHPGGN
jgi:hypothetical protein